MVSFADGVARGQSCSWTASLVDGVAHSSLVAAEHALGNRPAPWARRLPRADPDSDPYRPAGPVDAIDLQAGRVRGRAESDFEIVTWCDRRGWLPGDCDVGVRAGFQGPVAALLGYAGSDLRPYRPAGPVHLADFQVGHVGEESRERLRDRYLT